MCYRLLKADTTLRRHRVRTGCILPIGHSVLLHWIQTELSEEPEIVFNKSKIFIWAYIFVKKRRRVFALFKITFLRNRSLSNTRWFCAEKRKIGKGNLVETTFPVRKISTVIWITCVQKNSQIRTLIEQLFAKYRFFTNSPKILHTHKYCNF